jgi:hypothetical protein
MRFIPNHFIEDASTKPMVTISINDNWVEYTLQYVAEYRTRRTTKDLLLTRILKEIDKSSENIKFASATFDIELPTVDVKIKEK